MNGQTSNYLSHFRGAFLVTALGLALGAWVGWAYTGTASGTMSFFFICLVLAALEISLSFDNAVVNANVLKDMDPVWQRRFLTWGILIAVFGMRILFPLIIVAIAAKTGPIEAIKLAATSPETYAHIMHEAHPDIAAFGGAFLLMVALTFFFDEEKDVHWIGALESRFGACSHLTGIATVVCIALILLIAQFYPGDAANRFIVSAIYGLATFLVVDLIGDFLDSPRMGKEAGKAGLGAFLYLEVLDASFSFDGVVGAFALSHNLFIIAIGLGIGAMYVRSMTIMLVRNGVLAEFQFLEHGAFYAILVLAAIMFVQPLMHVPEVITGLIGVVLIGAALWSSLRARDKLKGDLGAGT